MNSWPQRDIVEFLNLKLKEQEKQILDYENRLTILANEKSSLMSSFDNQLNEASSKYRQDYEQLASEHQKTKADLNKNVLLTWKMLCF